MANRCRCNVQPTKNGPWGPTANVGPAKDVIGVPQRLESIIIKSGQVIDSLEFKYCSTDGKKHTRGPWGGQGGFHVTEINLDPAEFVREVSGTIGNFEDQTVVKSLKIVTNKDTYGPVGDEMNENVTPFSSCGTIVGFHGRSGEYLNSIGTYTV